MRVLVACEMSGRVRDAFIMRGHDAVSVDLMPTASPGPHIEGDVLEHLRDGWDMMIGFPPCTYLSSVGNAHRNDEGRAELREEAFRFFMALWRAPIERVASENPLGYPSTAFRAADQMIEPFWFGDAARKRTCLWLRGLPPLVPTHMLPPPAPTYIRKNGQRCYHMDSVTKAGGYHLRKIRRSYTFEGIADAMAEQWSEAERYCFA